MTQLLLRESGPEAFPTAGVAEPARSRPAGHISRAAGLELALVRDLDALEALEDEWSALHAEAGRTHHVFQTFDWCHRWCRHFLGRDRSGPRLAVCIGRIGGRLALILPLVTQRTAGLTALTWLGEPVSQYGDALALPAAQTLEALEAAWRFVVTETGADVANLRRVRADAIVAPLMDRLGCKVTATEEAPYLDLALDGSFAAWEHRRQPKARKNRRRQARRLAEQGEVAFHAHSGTPEAAALAAAAIRLKKASLDAKGAITLAVSDERFEAFFAEAAGENGRSSQVVVRVLTVAGRPIAYKILVKDATTSYLHIAAFDPGYEKCGPGALLLEHTIAETMESGRCKLDLLPPRHEYKIDFADHVTIVRDHALALSLKGHIYAEGYLGVRQQLKATIEGLPLPVRRVIARLVG